MQVFCKKTDGYAEVTCCVCGQGFVLFWDRHTSVERAVIKAEFQEILRRQHRIAPGREAHPSNEFAVPQWEQTPWEAEVAMAGKAPARDL
jgi:hypothetical protein